MGMACSTNEGEEEHILHIGGSQKETSLGRPRCRWVDNSKTDLGEIVWDGMKWSDRDLWGGGGLV
jgi:hypothetical protein